MHAHTKTSRSIFLAKPLPKWVLKMGLKRFLGAGCWWVTPLILATWEAEIRRITV
jgi:hypothetical protein